MNLLATYFGILLAAAVSLCVSSTPIVPALEVPNLNNAIVFYVHPNGSDNNSGRSVQAPWATPAGAIRGLRRWKLNNVFEGKPLIVDFMGRNYYINSTVEFSPSDSGTATSPVMWANGTIDGSKTLSNWAQVTNASYAWIPSGATVWKAELNDPALAVSTRQLWVNGVRRFLAGEDEAQYTVADKSQPGKWFQLPGAKVPECIVEQKEDVDVKIFQSWVATLHQLAAVDPSNGTLFLQNPTQMFFNGAGGNRFSLLNVRDQISSGRFYVNRTSGEIFYWALPSENPSDPSNTTISVPIGLLELVSFKGVSPSDQRIRSKKIVSNSQQTARFDQQFVEYIQFVAMRIQYSAVETASCFSSECNGQSVTFLQTATVHLSHNVRNVTFSAVEIAHTGGYGIWFDEATADCSITHSSIHDSAAGGVRIGIPQSGVVQDTSQVYDIVVADNRIFDGGHYYPAGCGVLAQSVRNTTVTHNFISSWKYTGVSVGWTWGYAPTSVYGNEVSFNEISFIGQRVLSDMGCVYTLGIQPGTVIENNICHDIISYNYGGWGLYTDEGSSFMHLRNNIVYNTKCAGFHQHYGENNTLDNNIFAFVDSELCDGALRSSQHAGSDPGSHSSFAFVRNIVYAQSGPEFYWTIPTAFSNTTMDYNCYFNNASGLNIQFPPGISFQLWRQQGKGLHSVISDPMFTDIKDNDFSKIDQRSPVWSLGFDAIDTSTKIMCYYPICGAIEGYLPNFVNKLNVRILSITMGLMSLLFQWKTWYDCLRKQMYL